MGILNHQVINLVYTTFERFHQSTSADNGIELYRNISLAQFVEHQLPTEVLLLNNIVEVRKFVGTMDYGANQYRRFVLKDGYLCGSRTWIDHKDSHNSEFRIKS
jgi:hypothetical protein